MKSTTNLISQDAIKEDKIFRAHHNALKDAEKKQHGKHPQKKKSLKSRKHKSKPVLKKKLEKDLEEL